MWYLVNSLVEEAQHTDKDLKNVLKRLCMVMTMSGKPKPKLFNKNYQKQNGHRRIVISTFILRTLQAEAFIAEYLFKVDR